MRLVERVPVMPLPAWRDYRTQPIDGRDVLAFLVAAATAGRVDGPAVARHRRARRRDLRRARRAHPRRAAASAAAPIRLGFNLTPVASRVAAAIAGEDHELVGPLMEGLDGDLLPRDDRAAGLLGVRLHRLDAAIERALRDWEAVEGAGGAIGSRRT